MRQLLKDKVSIIAGLALSCFVFSLEFASAEVAHVDDIKVVAVQDVQKDDLIIARESNARLRNTPYQMRLFDPNEVSTVLYGDIVPNYILGCKSQNKTYMSYLKVTNETSAQYWFLNSNECYTDEETGIRMVGDRYCIAVGSYWAKDIGTKLDVVMENGSVVKCIKGDAKADIHTDETNRFHSVDGSVIEMIIDPAVFRGTSMYPKELEGRILRIEVVE